MNAFLARSVRGSRGAAHHAVCPSEGTYLPLPVLKAAMQRFVRFGPFTLDHVTERLWRDAEIVPLRPQAFALLALFGSRPERLWTVGEIREYLWPRVAVDRASVKVCVYQVRRALHPHAFIESVHTRGYRFMTNGPEPPRRR